jgi:hypothetical protein
MYNFFLLRGGHGPRGLQVDPSNILLLYSYPNKTLVVQHRVYETYRMHDLSYMILFMCIVLFTCMLIFTYILEHS